MRARRVCVKTPESRRKGWRIPVLFSPLLSTRRHARSENTPWPSGLISDRSWFEPRQQLLQEFRKCERERERGVDHTPRAFIHCATGRVAQQENTNDSRDVDRFVFLSLSLWIDSNSSSTSCDADRPFEKEENVGVDAEKKGSKRRRDRSESREKANTKEQAYDAHFCTESCNWQGDYC